MGRRKICVGNGLGNRIAELRSEGYTYREIAIMLRMHYVTVWRYLNIYNKNTNKNSNRT